MKTGKPKTLVQAKHIDKGIETYKGALSPIIQKHLDNINWKYTAYQFKDGRILLVYPDKSFGILYRDEEALYKEMEQENHSDKSLDNL